MTVYNIMYNSVSVLLQWQSTILCTYVNMLDDFLTTDDLTDMFYENYLKSSCTLSYRCK